MSQFEVADNNIAADTERASSAYVRGREAAVGVVPFGDAPARIAIHSRTHNMLW